MSKSGEDLVSELRALYGHRDVIDDRITKTRQDIVKKLCPVQEGAVVMVTGYSHKGKQMKVLGVSVYETHKDKRRVMFKVHGKVLRKDGTETERFIGRNIVEVNY